jgi:isoleucyl-tRNA synthetase
MEEKKLPKSKYAEREEQILDFWRENKIFEKSLLKESPKGEYVFYEGPPTANAKPALHHLESRAFKDVIPRFKTMQGFHVPRRAGWDTHGLPVELQIEKKLGLTSKKDIEKYGIEAFNAECKASVHEYISDWEKFTDRIGYSVDLSKAYYTFNNSYIESVWNILKRVEEKGLLYKDYKVVPWCPRCGTALSSHELAQGYEDVKDLSVYVKFEFQNEPGTYILAWTTTPWTLPGNVGLAVGEKIEYVKVKSENDVLILAKERLSVLGEGVEIVGELKGKDLLGQEYKPLYPFLKEQLPESEKSKFENAYKIYAADFVTTEDGTGVVHTAVMYGQDDFVLGTKVGLPKYHLVQEDGHFKEGMDFLSGRFVKDEEVAVDIIKDLAHRGLLFKKEKYEHSYPHCWRCKTPLIYYARDSWYIRMSELRDELVKENEEINWEPAHIKEGRFGEWLREIKDWAISRERYWGTPLPIWEGKEGKRIVAGSVDDLKKYSKKSGNKYFVMRHGEAESNVTSTTSYASGNTVKLTERGIEQVKATAALLKEKGVTKIYSSTFLRTKDTAKIIAAELGLPEDSIIYDERLVDINTGEFEGKTWNEYFSFFTDQVERFEKKPNGAESLLDVKRRVGEVLYDIEEKNKNENVLIIAHGITLWMLQAVSEAADKNGTIQIRIKNQTDPRSDYIGNADFRELDFVPLPHNKDFELDLHKPYIDAIKFVDERGEELTRVKEVMDVWFDSGAMPFAQVHYPFDVKDGDLPYPADFISEAIDQTRGWFYTLHAIGVLMGKGKAYNNVICLGHILDAQGKKMSKSIGNIVNPWEMMDKFGVDALRFWMYSVNQPGDSKNFDEKTVDEIVKKVFNIIQNTLVFFEMYKDANVAPARTSTNILDRWIISKLDELVGDGAKYLESYKLFEPTRMIRDFANELSTWYLRRSRDRFKSDDFEDRKNAIATTRFVLRELSKFMAPFTPFFAEDIYQKVREESDPESVHLAAWPESQKVNQEILQNMQEVREVVSNALERRNAAEIKVRQPLNSLKVKSEKFESLNEYLDLIKDEVNVKNVIFDASITDKVELDTLITPELQLEGDMRELLRAVQDQRKKDALQPQDIVVLQVDTDAEGKSFIEQIKKDIQKPANIKDVEYVTLEGEEMQIRNIKFKINLLKV